MKRLTKASLAYYIFEQLYGLRLAGIIYDPDKASDPSYGAGETAYGKFRALRDLAKAFGIDPDKYPLPSPPKQKRIKPGPSPKLAADMKALRGYGQTEGYMRVIRESRGR